MDNIVQYSSRTFTDIKNDLYAYIKQQYPEVINDFNDSSVGAMLVDLNAGVNNNLSMNIDKAYQETTLDYAQLRTSLIEIAKNLGFNIPNKRPSVTVVDFSLNIPVLGDQPDPSYYPTLSVGAQVMGGGKIFETDDIIDWSSSVSTLGDPNRSIVPNYDSNGIIASYNVTKREVVVNGSSSIFQRAIGSADIVPFFTITLPNQNVTEIENVILREGTNNSTSPTTADFNSNNDVSGILRYYEVDYLAQQKIFVQSSSVNTGEIQTGVWMDITKKFIKEFTASGYCRLIFGSGDTDVNAFQQGFLNGGVSNQYFLDNFLNNTALGEKLKENYTLYVKYRTGGGVSSNVGAGVLTQLGAYTLNVNGSRQDFNQSVTRSLTVNNPIPAMGGNDGLSIEQIRELIRYNYSGQNRAVALSDYLTQLFKMPGKYGSPFRANVAEINNKVVLTLLGIGSDGTLTNTSNSLLKENITDYLSGYRMVNDFIEVRDGRIINIGVFIDVYTDNTSDSQIANTIIGDVTTYFDINSHNMNEDIFIGDLIKEITLITGVINVIGIKIYNLVGGLYSINTTSQTIADTTTGEIVLINNTIYSDPDSMFEIKFPETDITVNVRKRTDM
jgi:hypothetical protein